MLGTAEVIAPQQQMRTAELQTVEQRSLRIRHIAPVLLFCSGFCALVYQTTWLREFRLIFGASTAASAAVLSVFMGGLGFGGIFLGRKSESNDRPLRFYAQLELLIALSAGLSPLLILVARYVYVALGGTEMMGITVGTIVRLFLTAMILGFPTFLMGGTLPAVARAVVTRDDLSRRSLGILYGVNTLGAVTGAIAGTFYLFENLGNRLTLWWAAILNIAVALIAFHFSKSFGSVVSESDQPNELNAKEVVIEANPRFVFGAAGLVGFAFFLMEMVWYRMLGPLLGGSTFTFGLILAVALLGIGLGGVVYAIFDLKRSASLQSFAFTCAAEAFFIALPYALGDRIATAAMLLRPLGTLGFYGHIIAWSALCSVVVFPAAFMSGIQFPLLIALLGKGRERIGSQTGAAYAWNTLGALIGSLAGGFGFMPMLSAPGVWKLVVVILSAVAIIAVCFSVTERGRWIQAANPLAVVLVALLMLLATGPTAFWRHSQIGVGGLRQYHVSANEMRDTILAMRRRVVWQADGRESSVALVNSDSLAFIVNGKSDGNAKADAGTQVMSGMIGAALHPNPQKALVVGLGTGSTAGWLAAVPTIQRVDAIELERSILKVAELCGPVNHDALANPKLHVIIGDGRELLLTKHDKYDLVVSEPSNPYRAGVAGLFTREFYQSVEHRLAPGGLFLQWVQTYDVDDRTIEIFYGTLGSVFAHIDSWQTQEGDLLLVASREPIPYDAVALRHRLAQDPLKSAARAGWKADGLEDFLAHYVGNARVAQTLQNLQPWPLNTDDQTVIEFAFARSVSTANSFHMANFRNGAHAAHCDRPENLRGEIDWDRVEEARLSLYPSSNQNGTGRTREQGARAAALASYMGGDVIAALRLWRTQSQQPKTLPELALVAEGLASEGDPSSGAYINQLADVLPADAQAIRAELLRRQGKTVEAVKTLGAFLLALRSDPWPDQGLIRRSLVRAETLASEDASNERARVLYDILKKPLAVCNCETDRRLRLVMLAMHLDGKTAGKYTASALAPFEPNVMWERAFLQVRSDCYNATNSPRAAKASRDLEEFMNNEAFTEDVSAVTRMFGSRAHGKGVETYSVEAGRGDIQH
jgi:spermidine synthase